MKHTHVHVPQKDTIARLLHAWLRMMRYQHRARIIRSHGFACCCVQGGT